MLPLVDSNAMLSLVDNNSMLSVVDIISMLSLLDSNYISLMDRNTGYSMLSLCYFQLTGVLTHCYLYFQERGL